jgi:hypothetical protein
MDTLTQWLTATVAMILMTLGLGWAWIVGDEREQEYLQEYYEELRVEREYMQRRESHPADIWVRICIDGENWDITDQECV